MSHWHTLEPPCSTCKHHSINPDYTVVKLSVCNCKAVIGEKSGTPQACSVARSQVKDYSGRCAAGRFWEKK